MAIYTNLHNFFIRNEYLFETLKTDIDKFLKSGFLHLKQGLNIIAENPTYNCFDSIMFYISDLDSLTDIQVFGKNTTKSFQDWEYRGYAKLNTYISYFSFIANYKKAIINKLSLSVDEWLDVNTKNYPMNGSDNPIFKNEFSVFLAENIANEFQKCFGNKSYPWKNCFLDFFPVTDFHDGEIFDLKNNKWIKRKNYE